MIKIIIDKMSEGIWLDMMMHCGELNFSSEYNTILKEYEIKPDQTVHYIKSENFIDDIHKDKENILE